MVEKTSRYAKSATDMAQENIWAKKEAQAKQDALQTLSAIDNENNYIQDSLSQLRSMILHLRGWELNGQEAHQRSDIIEMLRQCEGVMERYSTQMKKALKRYNQE